MLREPAAVGRGSALAAAQGLRTLRTQNLCASSRNLWHQHCSPGECSSRAGSVPARGCSLSAALPAVSVWLGGLASCVEHICHVTMIQ